MVNTKLKNDALYKQAASKRDKGKEKNSKVKETLKNTAAIAGGAGATVASIHTLNKPLIRVFKNNKANRVNADYYWGYFKDKKNLRKLIDATGYKGEFVINDILKSGRLSIDPRDLKRNIKHLSYLDIIPYSSKRYSKNMKKAKSVDKKLKHYDKFARANSIGMYNSNYRPRHLFFPHKKDVVYAPAKNLYFAAHELGHATGSNFLTNNKLALYFSRAGGITPIFTAPITGALYDPNKKLEDQSTAAKVALGTTGVGAAAAGLTLAEEARASIRGARKLKGTGLGTYRGALKNLGPAFLTYATSLAAAPYVGYKASQFIKNKLQNNKEEDK